MYTEIIESAVISIAVTATIYLVIGYFVSKDKKKQNRKEPRTELPQDVGANYMPQNMGINPFQYINYPTQLQTTNTIPVNIYYGYSQGNNIPNHSSNSQSNNLNYNYINHQQEINRLNQQIEMHQQAILNSQFLMPNAGHTSPSYPWGIPTTAYSDININLHLGKKKEPDRPKSHLPDYL